MRVTIVKNDGLVSVDGVAIRGLDVSSLPSDFHALQWYGTKGEVEFVNPNTGAMRNETITSLAAYQACINAWTAAKYLIDNPPPSTAQPYVPDSITRRQCALQLLALGQITDAEAIAMARDGTPPAAVQAYINALPSAADRTRALIDIAAGEYLRDNPLLTTLMQANGTTPEQINQFFIAAAAL